MVEGNELLRPVADITESVIKLIAPFSDPVLNALGEYVAQKIQFIKFKNSLKVLENAKRMLDERNIEPNPVELKTLVPILEGAGLEENNELIDKWTGLLASAAGNCTILPSYTHIIAELSPTESKILDYIDANKTKKLGGNFGVEKHVLEKAMGLNREKYGVLIMNLRRLMLIMEISTDQNNWMLGDNEWGAGGDVGLTALGDAFLNACKGPPKKVRVAHLS